MSEHLPYSEVVKNTPPLPLEDPGEIRTVEMVDGTCPHCDAVIIDIRIGEYYPEVIYCYDCKKAISLKEIYYHHDPIPS